ncbi:MAG: hypothetical protein KF802_08120 [Bdellovibrionaceae bacterium]|nr:hypothetical protein [Pseudobdellovibrionaceae bacterium]
MQNHLALWFAALFTFVGTPLLASTSLLREIQADELHLSIQQKALSFQPSAFCDTKFSALTCEQQMNIWFSAIEDLFDNGALEESREAAESLEWRELPRLQKVLHYRLLRRTTPRSPQIEEIRRELLSSRGWGELSPAESHAFCRFVSPSFCPSRPGFTRTLPSRQVLKDLYQKWVNLRPVAGGRYAEAPRVYIFCRADRVYPCRALVKDKSGKPLRGSDGQLWSQPILAYSRHQKNFDEPGGDTPGGVHLVDGVMPAADQTELFGRFRRLILGFVPKSQGEANQKKFLPASSQNHSWWREGVVARDLGRAHLRVHGVGRVNHDRSKPYYGYFGTSGCMENRENVYDGVTYIDQRHFLDAVMKAMGKTPSFANEPSIRAVLYLVTLDDEKRAVTAQDLSFLQSR